jgi:hypothetical protein
VEQATHLPPYAPVLLRLIVEQATRLLPYAPVLLRLVPFALVQPQPLL